MAFLVIPFFYSPLPRIQSLLKIHPCTLRINSWQRLFRDDKVKIISGPIPGDRAFYQDFQDGSGQMAYPCDVSLHGPVLGLTIGW